MFSQRPHGHHGHHGHYTHRIHHNPGLRLGLELGLGLVGGAAAAFVSAPSQPVYYSYETPQQQAERFEAARIREETQKAVRESQRIKSEARQLELEQQRQEKEHVEDQMEKVRCENYNLHIQLINEAYSLPYDQLQQRISALPKLEDPIYRFRNSFHKGMPEVKDVQNLFSNIVFHPQLLDEQKYELLFSLINDAGYDKYYTKLFYEPLFGGMFNTPACFTLLKDLYVKHAQSNQNPSILDTEPFLWNHLIQLSPVNASFLASLFSTNPTKKLQFIANWIASRQTATEVIAVYNKLASGGFHLSEDETKSFCKIAKQYILRLELVNKSSFHPGEDNNEIRTFLGTHRDTLTSHFSCFFSTRSLQINHLIRDGQDERARRQWGAEDNALRENFYKTHSLR